MEINVKQTETEKSLLREMFLTGRIQWIQQRYASKASQIWHLFVRVNNDEGVNVTSLYWWNDFRALIYWWVNIWTLKKLLEELKIDINHPNNSCEVNWRNLNIIDLVRSPGQGQNIIVESYDSQSVFRLITNVYHERYIWITIARIDHAISVIRNCKLIQKKISDDEFTFTLARLNYFTQILKSAISNHEIRILLWTINQITKEISSSIEKLLDLTNIKKSSEVKPNYDKDDTIEDKIDTYLSWNPVMTDESVERNHFFDNLTVPCLISPSWRRIIWLSKPHAHGCFEDEDDFTKEHDVFLDKEHLISWGWRSTLIENMEDVIRLKRFRSDLSKILELIMNFNLAQAEYDPSINQEALTLTSSIQGLTNQIAKS